MNINLVFNDWIMIGTGKSVYQTEKGVELSAGDFHGGTTFTGTIHLDDGQEEELRAAIASGYRPSFLIHTRDYTMLESTRLTEEGQA